MIEVESEGRARWAEEDASWANPSVCGGWRRHGNEGMRERERKQCNRKMGGVEQRLSLRAA